MSLLPEPIGPNSRNARTALLDGEAATLVASIDPFDRDSQLGWFMVNEVSFGGWGDVSDEAEWNAAVVDLRRQFENWFVETIDVDDTIVDPVELVDEILQSDGASTSQYLLESGTREHVWESLMLRHPYQFKEADPHTFAVPRLTGSVKRALCEIQSGEYGVGHRSSHAELFVAALTALDDTVDHGGIIARLPGIAFATSNLVAMGGLNRSRRGVVVGQLALFEMESVAPSTTMVRACDRLDLPTATRRFFDVHVMADAEHEVIAREAFLIDYPIREPEQLSNVLFGIRAQHVIDVALADHAIGAWSEGASSLLDPDADRRVSAA